MRKLPKLLELSAWALCLLCCAILLVRRGEVSAAQRAAVALTYGHAPARAVPTPQSDVVAPNSYPAGASASSRRVLGRLEIPALHLTTAILDNDDMRSLRVGAGHIPGTAAPGGLGNFGVAAHRDTFFRPLSGIKPGMKINVITAEDTFVYVVDATRIVMPDQVEVLDTGNVPEMTLVTCYPFHYIGAAPKRFTVQAHLQSY